MGTKISADRRRLLKDGGGALSVPVLGSHRSRFFVSAGPNTAQATSHTGDE